MASFNYYLKDKEATEETPIYLRYNDKGINVKFYIGKKIHPKKWNSEDQIARRTFNGFSDFNSLLNTYESELKRLCVQLQATDGKIDLDTLKLKFDEILGKESVLTANKTKYLTEFVDSYIQSVTGTKKPNTIRQYKQNLRLLQEFETGKGRKMKFENVDLDFYSDFVEFLTREKDFTPNWIGKNIRNLKLFLSEAWERGLHTNMSYKSKRFKSMSEEVESVYLTEEEIEKIYKHDFSESECKDHTRDLFIVGCWTGLRFSDFSQLKLSNIFEIDGGEFFRVKTQKTGETVVIPVHSIVKKILQKYSHTAKGLPRTISNQKMNEYLKDIVKDAKVNTVIHQTKTQGGLKVETSSPKFLLVSTHTARRSFATNLYKSGFPSIAIMKITGHRTEKSFLKYIKIAPEENAQTLLRHWAATAKLKIA